ncbi:hypothetical protein C8Q80DRAFT_443624 [Daedaleopsis nitida]|nr:hypothetical protein C8Q80DRAFT_443624 [Daedaleopsis nitida]
MLTMISSKPEPTNRRSTGGPRHPQRRLPTLSTSASLMFLPFISFVFCQEPPIIVSPPPTSLTLCRPYTFTWTGGAPPYTLSLRIPLGQLDLPAALPFTNISAQRFTWMPDLIETELLARVFDSKSANATSTVFTVAAGDTVSCVKSTPVVDTAPSASTIPVSGAARQGLSPEALLGLVAGAVGLLLIVTAVLYWLWMHARDRRRGFSRASKTTP